MKSRKPLPVTSIGYQSSIRHPRSAGRSRGTAGIHRDHLEAPGAAAGLGLEPTGVHGLPPPLHFHRGFVALPSEGTNVFKTGLKVL